MPRRIRRGDDRDEARSGEASLAAAIARGDRDAMHTLHQRYGPSVFGVLRRALPDHAAAEDVFQQVMLEVWQRASSFDPGRGSLTTWMMMLARSRAIDELRRHRPEPVDPHGVEIADRADDHFEVAIGEWELADLLGTLPEDERMLLELRFRLGLSQAEIAERTGLPIGTIKTRMTRALKRLREALDVPGAGRRL